MPGDGTSSPRIWTKSLALWNRSIATCLPIAALLVHFCTPPLEVLHPPGVQEAEEDDDNAKGQTRVESSAEGHGVLAPPGVCAPFDQVVEDVADDGPDGEVEARGGGDPRHCAEYDGQVDLADDAAALVTRVQPQRDGEEGAERETPDQGAVGGSGAEELAWSDDAPEDRAVEVDARNGACEAVEGVGGADALDVGEHPVQHADLRDGRDEGGDDLDEEHESGRDFHVVPKLEVGGKLDALRGGNIAVGDKDHVCNGAAREYDAADELADEVDAAVLVGDGHDDAVGDEEYGADGEGQ